MAGQEDRPESQGLFAAVSIDTKQKVEKQYFEEECPETAPRIGTRHLQILLYFLVGFIGFGFRVVLSVGIVAMMDPKTNNNPAILTYPEWTDKNVILSAFFWGYIIPQVFAGWAASRFGAKWFLVITFTINSIVGFFIPFTARLLGSKGVMLSRAIQGFCQGFIFPSLTHLLSQWVPSEERSILGTIVYASGPCGTILAMFITGMISASWYGWPMAFYLYGVLGICWCVAMVCLGYDSPALHPSISTAERLYIEKSLGHTNKKTKYPTPWKAIFSSGPVWALFITQTGNNYCFWTLLTQIPSYMNYVMNFNIKENSVLSALPYLTLWILSFGVGFASDFIINRGFLTRTTSRKIFNSLGLFIPAVALVLLGYTGADQATQAVALLIIAVGSNAFHYSGFSVNHIDLSPNHAGTVMGLCNGFSQITGVVAPLVVQFFVTNETDPSQWRIIFFITAAFNILTATAFDIFGSGKVQPWNEPEVKN
ncbi:putative inorganic phosphate cotransporter [Euwallacea fornicatus]|uniref:putative inorganic phosphate cotransporter n=1 Tax=Euwallacea fornicatus TaxID=995702 RepID=UPI00338E06D6